MAEENKPFHQRVAEECIEALKNGTAPWIMPWEPGNMPEPPVNAVSGKPYRGINRLMLSMQQGNHIDPRWCTYKQAQELGAQVRKGEKGTTIQYWKLREERLLKDEQGRPLLNEEGQKRYSVAEFERPRVFYATVFHASQIENMPPLPERSTEAKPAWERHQQAERLLAASGATIFNDQVSRAFYQVTRDEIHLPPQNQFTSPDKYYATALHELGHWSGHENRLDRDIRHPFGSEGYAREELRAELASYLLGSDLGIGHDPDQHHAYIATWIKVLQEDPREIIRAAQDAERIREYVMGLERQQSLTNETGQGLAGQINRREFSDPTRAAVQEEAIMAVERNPEQFFQRYRELEQSYGGRFVNSDLFKETIPQYSESKDTRNVYNTAVHNTAAVLAAEQLKRVLAQEAAPGRDKVLLLTGVPGCGKSTSVLQDGLPPHAHAVYEGQLANAAVAVEKVQQVLDAGFKPVIVAVHVKPEQALDNALDRFGKIGRPVSIEAQARIQGGLPQGLAAVHERFGDQVELQIIDRRDFSQPKAVVGWDHLNTLESEGTYEHIKRRLAARLEQRKPELSDAAWRQASGLEPSGATQSNRSLAGLQHEKTQRPGSEGRGGEAAVLTGEKTWLNVPYKEKDAAKKAGARWDRQEKRWYAPEGTDLQPLQKWQAVPAQSMSQTPAVLEPGREFGQVLRDAGLVIEGDPILDGKIHRVPVVGGRRGAKDGAYSGHGDGRPNGWYQNHRTGVQGKWVSTGHVLTTEARNELRKEASENLVAAATDRQATQEKAQHRAYAKWMNAAPAQSQDHPYLTRKGIDAYSLRQDKHGNLVVPGYDLETGRLQTLEYINKEGGKWYEKGCPKKGAVCVLPDKDALKEADVVLMVEGYATGVSVHQATGLPVAVAFDAGNIKDAAMAIKRKMPNARITICADNDPPRPDGTNIGVMKAKEAAASIPGTKVVVADFSQDEKSRGLTDFNDLHQARGLAAVRKAIFAESEKDKQAEEVER